MARRIGIDAQTRDWRKIKEYARTEPHPFLSLSATERLKVALGGWRAVAALESLGVVHGDFSAANLLLTPSAAGGWQPAVIDFDGARTATCPPSNVLGTPGYRHPEQLRTHQPARSDRYAMAVLTLELFLAELSRMQNSYFLEDVLIAEDQLSCDIHRLFDFKTQLSWRDGFALFNRALAAPDATQCPSPAEWIAAITQQTQQRDTFAHVPVLEIKRNGEILCCVRLKQHGGSLHHLSPHLQGVSYSRRLGELSLHVPATSYVVLHRNGERHPLRPPKIQLAPNDRLILDRLSLKCLDQP